MSASDKDTKFQIITFEQQRLFAARNKDGYRFEFDQNGIWTTEVDDSGDDGFFFSRFGGDFFRGAMSFDDGVSEQSLAESYIDGFGEYWSKARRLSAEWKQARKELAPLLGKGTEFTAAEITQKEYLETKIESLERELGPVFFLLDEQLTKNQENLQPVLEQLQRDINWVKLSILWNVDLFNIKQELLSCAIEVDRIDGELTQLQGKQLQPTEKEKRSLLAAGKRECLNKLAELQKEEAALKINILRHIFEKNLGLTAEQAACFIRLMQQNLYGYHKRLMDENQPKFNSNGDLCSIDYAVSFSRQGEKIIAELHTTTDPELYSEFEILVSDLTDINGEPQCAPIKLISTKSKPSESGYWDAEGYHYYDPLKAEKFFNSIEEKKEAYAARNMIIESRDNPKRIQYNNLSAKLTELRNEHTKLDGEAKNMTVLVKLFTSRSKAIDSRMLEIEYEINGDPQLGKIGLLEKVTAIENEYGENSSTPQPHIFFTDSELTAALAQANTFCRLDENDSKIRGEEDPKQKRNNQLVNRRETLIQEKESLVEAREDLNRELEALDVAANKKRSSGLNVLLGVATLFTAGLALIPVAINRYFSIQKRNERRKEIDASERKITARTEEIERQLNKINSELEAITNEIDVASLIATMEVEAPKRNEYASSHVVSVEKRSGRRPVCSQTQALDKCGFLAKPNSQPPVSTPSQTVIERTAHLDLVSARFG